jgi:uncharacterized protein (TIGR02996 family)
MHCASCGTQAPGRPEVCPSCGRPTDVRWIAEDGTPPERFPTSQPQEAALVEALRADPADDATRQVYADWLEQHGFELRARFLRIECGAATEAEREVALKALAMSTPIDRLWRALASRAPLACDEVHFQFRCPKRWDSLAPTASDAIRHCGVCQKAVYFCTTLGEVRRRAAAQQCVAVDASLMRGEVSSILAELRHPTRVPISPPMGAVAHRPPSAPPPPAPPARKGLLSRLAGLFRRD